jgi:hypothetical protein
VVPAAAVAAGMGTEHESGEEDHGDDEDHARDNADPGCGLGDATRTSRGVGRRRSR